MAITFDTSNGPTELVIVLDAVTPTYSAAEIYSAWKQWVLASNANWPPAFRVVGGDDLGGGATAPSFFFVRNDLNWRIRKPESNIEVTINGNLVGEDPGAVISVPPLGAFTPTLNINLSQVATNDLDAFAAAVWARLLEGSLSAEDMLRIILAATAGKGGRISSTEYRYRDVADTKDRIIATTDGVGNRTAVTHDASD